MGVAGERLDAELDVEEPSRAESDKRVALLVDAAFLPDAAVHGHAVGVLLDPFGKAVATRLLLALGEPGDGRKSVTALRVGNSDGQPG